ncbi:GspE/PulE family protein [Peptococcaceae bacterium]|nr:GspE/PulE family protein [Peptococcaceae bacterium]
MSQLDIDPEAVAAVPEQFLRQHQILPLYTDEHAVTVAIAGSVNLFMLDDLQLITGKQVKLVQAAGEQIIHFQGKFTGDLSVAVEEVESELEAERDPVATGEILPPEESAPVIRLVNSIFQRAVNEGASDIHIEPFAQRVVVRFRIDGVLHDKMPLSKAIHPLVVVRVKILAGMDIAQRRLPLDGRLKINLAGHSVSMRISTLPTVHGEKVVVRVIASSTSSIISIKQLDLQPVAETTLMRLLQKKWGIIFVTGPTGSGKTTTLYSALRHLHSSESNIVTLEDPVENEIEGINQVQINVKAGLTFASGLRSILRQDPDIIMVGEIRDQETADIAVRAALTGHLVLSTLHTNDATSAVTRLLDMGIAPYMVAPAIVGVVAQRLLRRICVRCRQAHPIEETERQFLGAAIIAKKETKVYRGAGCDVCNNTGYRGRVGVYEILTAGREIKELIINRTSEAEIKETAIRQGMIVMADYARQLVIQGIVSCEEVVRVLAEDDKH